MFSLPWHPMWKVAVGGVFDCRLISAPVSFRSGLACWSMCVAYILFLCHYIRGKKRKEANRLPTYTKKIRKQWLFLSS